MARESMKDEVISKLQENLRYWMLEEMPMSEFLKRIAQVERLTERTIERD